MEKYLLQLISDIETATENLVVPELTDTSIKGFISLYEEESMALSLQLEEWTGIKKEQLPPQKMLSAAQINQLLIVLKKLLLKCNLPLEFDYLVPERVQYAIARENFDQVAKILSRHEGNFQVCKPENNVDSCPMEEECFCKWYDKYLETFETEESSNDWRQNLLNVELKHLKNVYGAEWVKYYPYHLGPDYEGNKNPGPE